MKFIPVPFVHPSRFVHLLTKVSVENFAKLVAFKVLQKWCGMLLHLHEYSTYYLILNHFGASNLSKY